MTKAMILEQGRYKGWELAIGETIHGRPQIDSPELYTWSTYYLTVADPSGRRWEHFQNFRYRDTAERFIFKVFRALESGKSHLNIRNEMVWKKGRPVYGSSVWQAEDWDGRDLTQEMEQEWMGTCF